MRADRSGLPAGRYPFAAGVTPDLLIRSRSSLPALKKAHGFLRDIHVLTCAWIAPGTGPAALDGEGTNAAQLHATATCQCRRHLIEQRGYDPLDVSNSQVRIILRQCNDQFRTGHVSYLILNESRMPK